MSIIEKLNWRYATKKFDTTKQLSDSQLEILKECGLPIISPSANKFNHISATKAEHVLNDF